MDKHQYSDHSFDIAVSDDAGFSPVERSEMFLSEYDSLSNFDCAGTFGCAGSFGGTLGSVGTFGCCC